MTIRRSAAAVSAVVFGLLALSACSKPTPLATVTVGDTSVHTQATCYRDGARLTPADVKDCAKPTAGPLIKIRSFDNFHVGVDPAIADKGWYLYTGGQAVTGVMKETYHTYGGAQLFQSGKTAVLDVMETANGSTDSVIGIWQFRLELAN
jgi:hypothetical protein